MAAIDRDSGVEFQFNFGPGETDDGRLFKHDYSFSIPDTAGSAPDLNMVLTTDADGDGVAGDFSFSLALEWPGDVVPGATDDFLF